VLITLPSGKTAWLIGDPHLGRKFETGVPLHRRGEREKRQFAKFVAELNTPGVDYNIMVGDLFDHPYVGFGVVVEAAEAVLAAARAHPYTTFIDMAGNHDLPRNLGVVGAWDAFEQMVNGRLENLRVAREPCWVGDVALFPWQWGISAVDQIPAAHIFNKDGWGEDEQIKVAIGHWDLQSYGGDDSHLAPVAELNALGITDIYSGHYHIEGEVGGVHCTGSLEPYSHGEDPNELIYVTRSLAEVLETPEAWTDKCVRVVLAEGEELPTDIDCMAMTSIRAQAEATEAEQVNLNAFDWDKVMTEALADVDPEVRDFIKDRMTWSYDA
jgi:hypothetical protein